MRRNLSYMLLTLTVGVFLLAVWNDEYRTKLFATAAILVMTTAFIGPPTDPDKEKDE